MKQFCLVYIVNKTQRKYSAQKDIFYDLYSKEVTHTTELYNSLIQKLFRVFSLSLVHDAVTILLHGFKVCIPETKTVIYCEYTLNQSLL